MILYDLSDTVVAVSSPAGGLRSILRITGPQAFCVCARVFEPSPGSEIKDQRSKIKNHAILVGSVRVNDALAIDAHLYLFFAPHSYTGEDLAELHVYASPVLIEALVQNLLARGLRAAGAGEFTARAYLNGKLDLAQAEAVNEVISSSNRLQLEAAERLLCGRLTQTVDEIHSDLLDILSRIEAGLDFSGEDIEFIGVQEAVEGLTAIQKRFEDLLAGSIRCETLLDLPAVGIAGTPNAGKSSLLNALLGWERSIVSPQPKTTRDVLSGILTMDRFQCVLFDCAGLVRPSDNPLDTLAQHAAVEALQRCSAVLFCVDLAKSDVSDDVAVHTLIRPKSIVHVATKSDLLSSKEQSRRTRELAGIFHASFLPVSSKTRRGLADLLRASEQAIAGRMVPAGPSLDSTSFPTLTARHRQAVNEAIESVRQSIAEVRRGHEEVAGMIIRTACQTIAQIKQQSIDEQVLDRIFSRFCIGK